VSPEMVVGIIAGGYEALVRSIEGAEDDETAASAEIERLAVGECDTVCGITASKRTPFVLSALQEAKRRGAKTVLVCCNPLEAESYMDIVINTLTGPELISGSTRLKAGTATKMVLNMLSTISMVLLGKTYRNYMVDLKPLSEKLQARSRLILSRITGLDFDQSDELLLKARGELKTAAAMFYYKTGYVEAVRLIAKNGGKIRLKDLVKHK